MNPTGWMWTVREQIEGVSGRERYATALPADTPGGTVNLSDLVPGLGR